MSDLSALVGKTVVAVVEDQVYEGTVRFSFSDGRSATISARHCGDGGAWLDIDYNDGTCQQDAGPVCLMGS